MGTVYVVTFYYEALDDEFEYGDVYGVYTIVERAKAAAKAFEKKCLEHAERYNGYSITEWMLDVDNGSVRDV